MIIINFFFSSLFILLDDMHDLLRALIPFGYIEEARMIQAKFKQYLIDIKAAVPEIFVPLQLAPGRVNEMKKYLHNECI